MNQFVQRVAHYIANELLVKGLAESKTFQRFVVHTDRHVQKYKNEGLEQVNTHIDELHKKATAAYSTSTKSNNSASATSRGKSGLKPPQKPMEGIPGFFSALGKIVRKDLGIK